MSEVFEAHDQARRWREGGRQPVYYIEPNNERYIYINEISNGGRHMTPYGNNRKLNRSSNAKPDLGVGVAGLATNNTFARVRGGKLGH